MGPTSSASTENAHTASAETASLRAAHYLCAALLAVNLVRAITQSVTPDEALNYIRYVAPAWAEALASFDVNNHVLNTLLVRISTSRFHLTELSMRLPSLLAGALYLWVVCRLARRWFGDSLAMFTVVGLLTLNPLVVDTLSEARGYGMALAFWTLALYLVLESTQSFSARNLNLAAVCLGLSVTASLPFAAPACALLLIAMLWFKRAPGTPSRRLYLPQYMFLTMFVLLTIPVNHSQWATLGIGATSLRQTINEITSLSLGTSIKVVTAAARVAVAFAAVAGALVAMRHWRRADAALPAIMGATLPLTLLLLLGAHRYLHTPFPRASAVFMVPLIGLFVSSLIVKQHTNPAQIRYLAVLSGVLLIRYIALFPVGMYAGGAEFAGGRILAKTLRATAGGGNVRVGVSSQAEPILNYYRLRYHQENWQPQGPPGAGPYDYYVLTPADAALIEQRHLHVIYRDSGLALAN